MAKDGLRATQITIQIDVDAANKPGEADRVIKKSNI